MYKLAIDSYETYRGPSRFDFAKTEALRSQLLVWGSRATCPTLQPVRLLRG